MAVNTTSPSPIKLTVSYKVVWGKEVQTKVLAMHADKQIKLIYKGTL